MTQENQEDEPMEKVLGSYNMGTVEEAMEKEKKYITFADGEKRTLKIDPTRIDQVEVEYEKGKPVVRYRLYVKDVNAGGIDKTWTIGPKLLREINAYLIE